MITIRSNYHEADASLRKLLLAPTAELTLELDMVLQLAFAATQAAVHIETASLRESGKAKSSSVDGKWSGEIDYGGESSGVHNPVVYAYYEKRRGGAHDYMSAVALIMDQIGPTIAKGLS